MSHSNANCYEKQVKFGGTPLIKDNTEPILRNKEGVTTIENTYIKVWK